MDVDVEKIRVDGKNLYSAKPQDLVLEGIRRGAGAGGGTETHTCETQHTCSSRSLSILDHMQHRPCAQ